MLKSVVPPLLSEWGHSTYTCALGMVTYFKELDTILLEKFSLPLESDRWTTYDFCSFHSLSFFFLMQAVEQGLNSTA